MIHTVTKTYSASRCAFRAYLFSGILLLMCIFQAKSQDNSPTLFNGELVYVVVEKMPEYPGGMDKLFRYISSNLRYPKAAAKAKVSGTVLINFIVDAQGLVQEVTLMQGVHEELDNEALRLIREMPAWKPGSQDGKNVNVRYSIPIKFTTPGRNR